LVDRVVAAFLSSAFSTFISRSFVRLSFVHSLALFYLPQAQNSKYGTQAGFTLSLNP
jgi:hypothetical protein